MLDRVIDLYHAGGFVMPPLLIAAGLLWFSMSHRALLLTRGDLGVYQDFLNKVFKIKNDESANKDDALILLSEEEDELSRYKGLVNLVVVLAPLLGLLGTVSGMIETFDSLAEMSLFSQSGGIAGGISQALISTQMGLAVAIPGLIAGRLLERRQTALVIEMEETIEKLWSPLDHKMNATKGVAHA
ncbi:MAG: MotA/TolQ/ExbB proton channel family protein [Bacteriovoracaceae bacterium]|nr:MotA/TolQ/ExbB proton channel family protein [Bacteriovoracaceae bacterium]